MSLNYRPLYIPERSIKLTMLRKAQRICSENNATLLFLTFFGSILYGTFFPQTSDIDVRGVFLPKKLFYGPNVPTHGLHYSSADMMQKNSFEDFDIDLISIDKWLLDSLPHGYIPALDLLFSVSFPQCTLYMDERVKFIFENPSFFINSSDITTCLDYCLKQTKKYGIYGSRIYSFQQSFNFITELISSNFVNEEQRLEKILNLISEISLPASHVAVIFQNGERILRFFGKNFSEKLPIKIFIDVLQKMKSQFIPSENFDWKAISHAVRALRQQYELLEQGKITFPLSCRDELKQIKNGELPWNKVESLILSEVNFLKKTAGNFSQQQKYKKVYAEAMLRELS